MTPSPLLGPVALELARQALADYTADTVNDLLGLPGQAAHQRGDLAGVARAVRGDEGRLATLVRLFLLGRPVAEQAARAALRPLDLDAAAALVELSGGEVRARVEVRPYAVQDGPPWWVVSDFGSDVRPGPLAPDHVLGIGAASLTLAQAAVRRPAGRALDLGTGCGVQALHLAQHSDDVVATDVSARALDFAATTAALSGQQWDLRQGSLLEPVDGERFDVVVANPPFVVSPGLDRARGGYDYRDSGLGGDAVSEQLVRQIPGLLAPGGTATLLANWAITPDTAWDERVGGWLAGTGVDAWVWQREVVDPGSYVSLWLRDAGEVPGTARWVQRYDAWCDWFDSSGIVAVGMGLVSLRRTDGSEVTVVCEDVPQPVDQPVGPQIAAWFDRAQFLRASAQAHGVDALLHARLRLDDGVVLDVQQLRSPDGWRAAARQLRQSSGLRWELEVDESVATLLAGCDGSAPVSLPVSVLAARLGADDDAVWSALRPVVTDLVRRGVLVPAG